MANYGIERKNYSKITAQIAKNVVRKKILEIRSRGARAADELIDDLIEKHQKSPKRSFLGEKAIPIVERSRSRWRNFIIELSGRFDADVIATLGVNLIYGGIMTTSAGNSGWASVLSAESADARAMTEIISKGRNRGNLVWLIRGKEAFSPEIVKSYRYFPECAFVLARSREESLSTLSGAKNTLVLLKKGDQRGEKELLGLGIPYISVDGSDPIFDPRGKGRESSFSFLPPSLLSFLENPGLPITVEGLSDGLNAVENLLSEGKSRSVPYYFA